MGYKKKLARIADAVEGIVGNSVKAKKLKKVKALNRFINKMETKRAEISAELLLDELTAETRERGQRHLETLDKQINKANKILDQMK